MTPSQKHYDKLRIRPGETSQFIHHGGHTVALLSQQEVGRILGISRQAVHQSERNAIRKIRFALIEYLREMNPELADSFCK